MDALKDILPDFQPGPLDEYRKKANFHWRNMKCILENEEQIRMKYSIWKTLEKEPLFQRSLTEELTWQEDHHLCFKRFKKFVEFNFLTLEEELSRIDLAYAVANAVYEYDYGLCAKIFLSCKLPLIALLTSQRADFFDLIEKAQKTEVIFSFALTEIGHGSNTQGICTKAIFDPQTQEFILHTPDFLAAKAWVGNLGQTATHVILFAKLYTSDGQCHGLRSFVVPVRDPKTFLPYEGITVGDFGPKIGFNSIDNGFIMFNNYRISKASLMGPLKISTDEKQPKNSSKTESSHAFEPLSFGRVSITTQATTSLKHAISIAIRYSAVRCQGGPTPEKEIPIIEYQLQQWRLLPFLSATYALSYISKTLADECIDLSLNKLASTGRSTKKTILATYMHAISCCAKAVTTWTAKDCAIHCREACGGHGYLKAAGFGKLLEITDVACTYEGANNLLLQSTSKYLLSVYKKKISFNEDPSSFITDLNFIKDFHNITLRKFPSSSMKHEMSVKNITEAYEWLVCHLMKLSAEKYKAELENGFNDFYAISNSQVFFGFKLAIVYFHYVTVSRFHSFVMSQQDESLKIVLDKLCRLYGLWTLEQFLDVLYSGGYCAGENPNLVVKDNILQLCKELKDEAVALVDAIAPPDFVLQSVLGRSDGQVYKGLEEVIMNTPGALQRPSWLDFQEKSSKL